MDRGAVFDHFYDQYRAEVSEADYLYRRAALWLTANGLAGTVLAAVAIGSPERRFSVDVTEPTSAVVAILTAVVLLAAFICMGLALFPRQYGRFSLPHEILAFRAMYRADLEQAGYPAEHRDSAESDMMFEELSKVLAEKTKRNAELNEARHRLLGRSSMLTLVAVGGLMILLTSAAVSAANAPRSSNCAQQLQPERFERAAPAPVPIESTRIGDADARRSSPPNTSAPVESASLGHNDERRMMPSSQWGISLVQNVVGGILSAVVFALLVWGWRWLCRRVRLRRFERFFGASIVDNGVSIVCAELHLRKDIIEAARKQDPALGVDFPYLKPGVSNYAVTTERPVALSEIRAVNYLSAEFRRWLPSSPSVVTDVDVRANVNFNFVSLGFGSNLKTRDALGNAANTAIDSDFSTSFTDRSTKQPAFQREPGFDYGLILKIHPTQFPHRSWFCCAGVNEWGTSGAAWFLANNWERELLKRKAPDGEEIGTRPFAAWVRVRPGQDESTEIVRVVTL